MNCLLCVKNGETYSDPAKDVKVSISVFDQSSWSFEQVQETAMNTVSRRTTLKDIGYTLPEMASPRDGMNQIVWMEEGVTSIAEDTELLVSNTLKYAAI